MIKIEASPTGYGISFSEFKKAPVLSSVKDIWFSNDQGSSDNTQGSFFMHSVYHISGKSLG